jgi:hypothetical protein
MKLLSASRIPEDIHPGSGGSDRSRRRLLSASSETKPRSNKQSLVAPSPPVFAHVYRSGAPEKIGTSDLCVRRAALRPVEAPAFARWKRVVRSAHLHRPWPGTISPAPPQCALHHRARSDWLRPRASASVNKRPFSPFFRLAKSINSLVSQQISQSLPS